MQTSFKHKLIRVIIIILITSSGIGGFFLFRNLRYNSARCKVTKTSIEKIQQAVNIYAKKHEGRLPSSIEELLSPYNNTPDGDCFGDGKTLSDSWGINFEYKSNGKTCSIRSAGPDMKMGTKDDITN
jgi:hypothetical protein